jgi:phosphoribosylanthranilate isomerase
VLFFPKSKRNVTLETAGEIISALDSSIKKVAVTVSPTASQVKQIQQAGFDYIQIHGDIADEVLEAVTLPILKAFNVSDLDSYEKYHSCPKIAGYVFDAAGYGSGKTFDWGLLKNVPRDEKLFILAGGLNPNNVADAVKAVQPDGVDVSSGVENDSGAGKSPEKIRLFAKAAREE